MSAPFGPTDAELVAGVLAADRDAFAQVYDRYGTKLYDFAYSMLRHREDAADAVADSFVLFAERLPQLRDPDRLRPWLYAITRSECLRRLKARKRVSYGDDEQLMAMPDTGATPEEEAERAALAKIVWDAAAGLADRDRALLDLHLRQGLEGAELGEAMGVTAANAYVMLNRLRGQVDRSLGALLIARMGREECADLDDLLDDWDGTFSPLIRKRVARHVEKCEICSERRRKIVSPWMLLASVPVFVAPLSLRDRVLTDTQLVAFHLPGPGTGTSSGSGPTTSRRRGAIAAAAFLLIGGGVTTAALWPEGETGPLAPLTSSSTPTPSTSPAATPTPSPKAKPTATASPTARPTVTAAPLTPGVLVLATDTLDLGRTATTARLGVRNTGQEPLSFAVTSVPSWLTVSPQSGDLAGGATRTLTLSVDRSQVAEGPASANVVIAWSGRTSTVKAQLTQENDPVVGRPTAANPSCTTPTVTASAVITDESPLRSVQLRWSGPDGPGSAAMSRSGSRWVAPMGPFTSGGTVTFEVVATDSRGNTTTGPSATVTATPCPG